MSNSLIGKKIKQKIVIDIIYANEWQRELHEKTIQVMLIAMEKIMSGEYTDIPSCKNKDNKLSFRLIH